LLNASVKTAANGTTRNSERKTSAMPMSVQRGTHWAAGANRRADAAGRRMPVV